MKTRFFLILTFELVMPLMVMAQVRTIQSEMDWLYNKYKVSFVYESSLPINKSYTGPSVRGMELRKALNVLFNNSGIKFRIKGNYILLNLDKRRGKHKEQDKQFQNGKATAPNSHRRKDKHESSSLDSHMNHNTQLDEVIVNGNMNSPLLATQTGKRTFSQDDIKSAFSLASSPDVVKTIQLTSGVTTGVELASGLYVHGGGDDENLFLLDGSPLYAINHTLGLFSAFNVDVVKDIDFYKSGFPARYGGRLSSVVDVHTADGDMQHLHGSYRVGLLDGSFHIEGPIRKDKTSFNIGLRRSWIDLLTRPFCAIRNHHIKNHKVTLNYFFHDFNAKLTNIFNERSRLSLSLYSGEDKLRSKDNISDNYGDMIYKDITEEKFSWGNFNSALDWQYHFSSKLYADFTAFYTYNRSRVRDYSDEGTIEGGYETYTNRNSHSYHSTINDLGYRIAFDFRPSSHHHIRFGTDYTWHSFRPQSRHDVSLNGESGSIDSTLSNSRNSHYANEWNVYAEDEMTISDQWSLNAGVNVSLFHISGKTFSNADPRLAVKYQFRPNLSFKLSATTMSQYVHKIANTFLELPTDYWVPTTARLHPMKSLQFAAGVYYQPDNHWLLSLEGYIKRTRHILQYSSWNGLEPPADNWDEMVLDGRGKFYGLELDAIYKVKKLTLQGSYTLSWNKRKYDDFYPNWFYDKFDNRHKLNISAQWNISNKVSMFAVWTFHTGNHITVPTQYVVMPNIPDGKPVVFPSSGYGMGHQSDGTISDWFSNNYYESDVNNFIFERPNNFTLPAYHRLDVGFNFTHKTSNGHEIIWNLSVYNAYCHMNSMYVDIDFNEHGRLRMRNHSYFPILPSLSYSYKF